MGKQVERNFQVEDTLGVISKKGKVTKEVNFVSWNGAEGKVDLRKWIETDTGKNRMFQILLFTSLLFLIGKASHTLYLLWILIF